jgi:hypothetical protein
MSKVYVIYPPDKISHWNRLYLLVYIHLRLHCTTAALVMEQLELNLSLGVSGKRNVRKIVGLWYKKLWWKFQWFIYNVQNNLINTLNKLTYVCYSLVFCKLVPDVLWVFFKCRWLPLLLMHCGYSSAQLEPLWLVDGDVLYFDKPLQYSKINFICCTPCIFLHC